jgi:hypothetical protein
MRATCVRRATVDSQAEENFSHDSAWLKSVEHFALPFRIA